MPDFGFVQPIVAAYKQSADSAAEAVLHNHAEAMIARDVEDLVRYGIFVMDLWFRRIDAWHTWVSESYDRYRAQDDELIRSIEQDLLDAGHELAQLMDKVTNWGYTVGQEQEFKSRLRRIESCARPIGKTFQETTLREHFAQAVVESVKDRLEETQDPWNAA